MRRAAVGVLCALLQVAAPVAGQSRPDLRVNWEDGRTETVPLATDRGYAAVPVGLLERLGWSVEGDGADLMLRGPEMAVVRLSPGSPFIRWDGELLQMTDATYQADGGVWVPAQLLTDFLPRRLSDLYAFDGPGLTLRAATGEEAGGPTEPDVPPPSSVFAGGSGSTSPSAGPTVLHEPSEYEGVRVVIIDAGHGGRDPGSISASGIEEKTIALAVARSLARRLEAEPGVEVHLIRDDDTFVPLWDRGPMATRKKGDRPGVLLSIHANSFSSPARGFETYFLSEARNEHERRVAAIENAPLPVDEGEAPEAEDLGFILRELRNLDHQHWSALLAEMIQEEVDVVHPGPNRGVKQAPLAVITNALMPSVLVEVGYLSNPDEARLLARGDFQEEAGEAIAEAVLRFFQRYPGSSWSGAGEGS